MSYFSVGTPNIVWQAILQPYYTASKITTSENIYTALDISTLQHLKCEHECGMSICKLCRRELWESDISGNANAVP